MHQSLPYLGSRRPKWNDFKETVLICTIEHCNKNNKPLKYSLFYGHNICIEADLSVRSSFCENKITMPFHLERRDPMNPLC